MQRRRTVAAILAGVMGFGLVASPSLRAQDRTSVAIDKGIEYLLPATKAYIGEVRAGGKDIDKKQGQLALQVYALLVAGVSHEAPVIREAFGYLNTINLNHIYTISCYIFALDAAISQIENDLVMLQPAHVQAQFRDNPKVGKAYRPRLEAAINALRRSQNSKGVWRYKTGAQDFDNSNVQFAVLGLGVGAKRGIPIDKEVWIKVMDHFVKGQQKSGGEIKDRLTMQTEEEQDRRKHDHKVTVKQDPDDKNSSRKTSKSKKKTSKEKKKDERTVVRKTVPPDPENPVIGTEAIQVFKRGWDYENKGKANWNMTCAGLSSVILARINLKGKLPPSAKKALDKSIRDGYGWVMGHWGFSGNYYGAYSLEKVADIGHVKLFGSHDWYAEVSSWLLGAQKGDGSWPEGGGHGSNVGVNTSFALLILNRATATTLLTRNPANRIMISGRTSNNDPEDRSWVYVPDLDTTIHYPSLLRTLRLRPHVKILKFLQNIVDNYPDEWKGELIPELAKVRDQIPDRRAQKIVDDYLNQITGSKYKTFESYMKWHRRWLRVRQIGTTVKKERADDLLKYYKHTEQSIPLKKTIMWALIQLKEREALPLFLDDLDHKKSEIRLAAYNSLKSFFVEYPPAFDPVANATVRKAQVAAIRKWYRKESRRLKDRV